MATSTQSLAAVERLHDEFGFRYDEVAQAPNTNDATLHRWRGRAGGELTPCTASGSKHSTPSWKSSTPSSQNKRRLGPGLIGRFRYSKGRHLGP
jgi:hypothetical protein